MNKAHSPINWENYPEKTTPINEVNLNKMDRAIGIIDDRVIEHEHNKLSKTDASSDIVNVEYNEDTSVFEFTKRNGDVKKIAISNVVVDDSLSEKSTNPVQNKVVTEEFSQLSEEIVDVKSDISFINDTLYTIVDIPTLLSSINNVVFMPNSNANAVTNVANGTVYCDAIKIETLDGYHTYYFVADKDYKIYTKEIGDYYAITIGRAYTDIEVTSAGYTMIYSSDAIRYRNTENNLPTETDKLVVNTGDVVAFTVINADTEIVYGMETEKKIISSPCFVSKTGDQIEITTNNARYIFKRITRTDINIDTWRLYQGDLVSNGTVFNMWASSDAEGVVKINGEDDYLGGYHGDETLTALTVFIDGKEIDMETDFSDLNFNNLTIYVESILYHCNTSEVAGTVAFDKHKMLIFEGNKVRIGNWFKARENLVISSAPTALFQCQYKDENGNEIATTYSVDSDYKRYKFSEASSVYPIDNKNMKEAQIQTKYGFINFKLLKSSAQNYLGSVAKHFITDSNRIKFYFYAIGDGSQYEIAEGEIISSEFEFEIIN